MVIGGQAVLIYGEARFTNDIDITLGVDIDRLEELKSAVKKMGFKITPNDPDRFAADTNVLPVIDKKSGIGIDFIFSYMEYERAAIKRAKNVNYGGIKVKFTSAEDLVIHKITAGRPKDMEDAKNIIIKQKKLDLKYIRKWLAAFDESLSVNHLAALEKMIKMGKKRPR